MGRAAEGVDGGLDAEQDGRYAEPDEEGGGPDRLGVAHSLGDGGQEAGGEDGEGGFDEAGTQGGASAGAQVGGEEDGGADEDADGGGLPVPDAKQVGDRTTEDICKRSTQRLDARVFRPIHVSMLCLRYEPGVRIKVVSTVDT